MTSGPLLSSPACWERTTRTTAKKERAGVLEGGQNQAQTGRKGTERGIIKHCFMAAEEKKRFSSSCMKARAPVHHEGAESEFSTPLN
jgi:hypothetical protein